MVRPRKKTLKEAGFTIIELLIATLIFSVVLLIATLGVIQITKTYIKGFIASETQNTTRTIVDDITQAVQLAGPGGVITTNLNNSKYLPYQAFCINGYRYTFVLNQELGASGVSHVFVVDQPSSDPGCVPNVGWANQGIEIMGANERLTALSITKVTAGADISDLYEVQVGVLYGNDSATVGGAGQYCLDISAGGSFCATTSTTATVEERL